MDHRLIVLILFSLFIGEFGSVNGLAAYKWIPFKSGDVIPSNAVSIDTTKHVYVGRARHFNEILLAEINATGSAVILSCNKKIPKEEFEILTTSEDCEWKSFHSIQDIDQTAVRGGTAWDNEPIYIGTSNEIEEYYDPLKDRHILSIYLNNFNLYKWNNYKKHHNFQYLSCNLKNTWIDSSAVRLPNNTVYGGKSEEGYDIYVAKLKRYCVVYVGQVIPEIGSATAKNDYEGIDIEADYCQVLVGEPDEYTWVSASDGEIPDYAVTNEGEGQLTYVVRINNTITQLSNRYGRGYHLDYDILVENLFF